MKILVLSSENRIIGFFICLVSFLQKGFIFYILASKKARETEKPSVLTFFACKMRVIQNSSDSEMVVFVWDRKFTSWRQILRYCSKKIIFNPCKIF